MIDHLIFGAARPKVQWKALGFLLLLGGTSFVQQNGRALLMVKPSPKAFAAIAQSAPTSISGLNSQAGQGGPGGRRFARRGGAGGTADPAGDRPISFGVGPAEPLDVGGRNAVAYRPDISAPGPSIQSLPNFVAPDDVLPAAGGAAGNASTAATPPTPAVPEPSSWLLMLLGMMVLGGIAWRRSQRPATL